jgi:LuxR family transcriptional regulator, maltose regulon positive regulatory protein
MVGMTTSHPAGLHVPRTKLHRPRRPADLIDRPHLVARLSRAVDVKMTLLWAPAGYGKSTLLTIWAAAGTHLTAWLSLDEQDDALVAFVRSLVAAVQTVLPGVGKDTLALLNLPEPPSPTLLAITLTDELSSLSDPLVLVLDNYDQIRSPFVHELLSDILLRLPERPHVVVASRTLPPLPLPTLRAEAQLAEIGVDDLRFGPGEARMFLDSSLDEHLPERTVTFLLERTEGWPVGLRLAAILLRDRPDRESVLAALATGSHDYIRDYLLDEMLAGQPADVRRFMLETAILDRFCAALCVASCSRPPSSIASVPRSAVPSSAASRRARPARC